MGLSTITLPPVVMAYFLNLILVRRTLKEITMKEILIAVDYDLAAQKIAETGYSIGKALGAHITLLHVVVDAAHYYTTEHSPIMGSTGFSPQNFEKEIAEIKETASGFLENVKAHLKDG